MCFHSFFLCHLFFYKKNLPENILESVIRSKTFLFYIFLYFEIKLFYFVVALNNLVHDVETKHGLC